MAKDTSSSIRQPLVDLGTMVSVAFRALSFGSRASHLREWRNRQTRTVQVRVPERAWGFNSPLAHQ